MKRNSFGHINLRTRLVGTLAVLLMVACTVKAGDRDRYIGLSGGVMYPRIFSATLHVEQETRYHNAYEAYVDYFTQWDKCATCGKVCHDSFFHQRYGLSIGGAYKPCVHRGRNSFGRVRMGADLGTNTRNFVLGFELGYEYVWTLRSGVQLAIIQKNEVNFWAKPTWKNGLQVGVRVPL